MSTCRRSARSLLLLCAAACIGVAVAGCREDEQDRVLRFEKGTYLGEPDSELTAEQVEALRKRTEGRQI